MQDHANRWLASLTHRAGVDADAAQIASAIVSTLREIDAVLAPVIGRTGSDALYGRCLHLASLSHPWLTTATRDAAHTHMDLAALEAALAQQSCTLAAAAGVTLLQTFNELLDSLVGASLTDQLLGSVWVHLLDTLPTQDT